MRTIIVKELRENAKWALLLLIAFAALMATALYKDASTGLSLVGPKMQMVTVFGFPVAGFALGLLQILQDYRTGRWSFLTHRPVSRTRIFFAKIIAGILLYLPAAGIPLAASICWASVPGNVNGPFDWHMALPRIADLISGFVWYAAGLLVAARRARWIGSRLLPAVLATYVSAMAFGISLHFGHAILCCLGGIAVSLPAAWGAFVAAGEYEPQRWITRLFQFLSLLLGATMVVIAAIGIPYSFLGFLLNNRSDQPTYQYELNQQGKVFRIAHYYTQRGQADEAVDLEGRSLSPEEVSRLEQSPLWQKYIWLGNYHQQTRFQESTRYIRPLDENWFYVVPRRTIEGFNEGQFIGSIGPGGFASAQTIPVPFPQPLETTDAGIIASNTKAYRLDIASKTIKSIFVTTPDAPIISASPWNETRSWSPVASASENWSIVIPSTLVLFERDREKLRLPLDKEWKKYSSLLFGQATDGRSILHYNNPMGEMDALPPELLVEADATGHIQKRTELPPFPKYDSHEPRWLALLPEIGTPPAFMVLRHYNDLPITYVLRILVIGALSAIATRLLFRRYHTGPGARRLWMTMNFLLGLIGIVLLLCLRQREPLVRCPACGKRRIVSRDKCEHCAAAFPAPALQGIEVFAA